MLVKLFSRGVGKGKGPVEYCVLETVPRFDPETRRRIPGAFETRVPPPVVLRGDPKRTTMLIDSSENKWKYTSGVLPFELSDKPTDEEIDAVMDSFEAMAFAGLEKDQYDILWIKHTHTDTGNTELHFVAPRLELATGKALNIAPPGYAPLFDAWRDIWNYGKGWASPDEPSRARLGAQDDHVLKQDAALIKAGLERTDDPKRLLTEFLLQRIEAGTVKNRADVLASLQDAGLEINRQGKDYISVRPEPGAKPIRLKGVVYGEGFEISFDRAAALRAELGYGKSREPGGPDQDQDTIRGWRNPESDAKRASAASAKFAALVERRARFNTRRYCVSCQPDSGHLTRHGQPDQAGADGQRPAITQPDRADYPSSGLEESRARNDFDRGTRDNPDRQQEREENVRQNHSGNESAAARNAESIGAANEANALDDEAADVGTAGRLPGSVRRDLCLVDLSYRTSRPVRSAGLSTTTENTAANHNPDSAFLPDTSRTGDLHAEQIRPWHGQITTKIKGFYDRARNAIVDSLRASLDAVQAGCDALGRTEHCLVAAGASVVTASRELEQNAGRVGSKIDHAVGVLKMHRDDELSRFKTDINLVEYAESQGYSIDKKESSRASKVMRRDDDKIVVATDADGHGIFFSVRDDSDSGTIIDFVQKRLHLSLGHVRKELRPWTTGTGSPSYRPVSSLAERAKPISSNADRRQVLAAWMRMKPLDGKHVYLERERQLTPQILSDVRFAGMVRVDARDNAVFPHYDSEGLAGYELKNHDFTGFSTGGTKAVWHSANLNDADTVVIVESAIDALSHAQIFGGQNAYLSTGGAMSEHQRNTVRGLLAQAISRGAVIVIGTDNDDAGADIATQLGGLMPLGSQAQRQVPEAKDWNDQMRVQRMQANQNLVADLVRQQRPSHVPTPG